MLMCKLELLIKGHLLYERSRLAYHLLCWLGIYAGKPEGTPQTSGRWASTLLPQKWAPKKTRTDAPPWAGTALLERPGPQRDRLRPWAPGLTLVAGTDRACRERG